MTTDSKRTRSLAKQRHKHAIYQDAVQSPQADVELLQYFYQQSRNKTAFHFREDFCGTAVTLAHWLQQGLEFSGEGFDIDRETVDWGEKHNFDPLNIQSAQAVLHVADAREASRRAPDIRCAFNFSYWIFLERDQMREYLESVYHDLADEGVFVVDFHGGPQSLSEEESISDYGDFESVWHQTDYSPITNTANLSLHFRFPDGSSIEHAFRYHWRIWSIPEISDLLREAGFDQLDVYWYDGEGDYELTRKGYNDPSWICCLVALK